MRSARGVCAVISIHLSGAAGCDDEVQGVAGIGHLMRMSRNPARARPPQASFGVREVTMSAAMLMRFIRARDRKPTTARPPEATTARAPRLLRDPGDAQDVGGAGRAEG